jgi:DNA invertase Pin-like site-specific DNA recombinase
VALLLVQRSDWSSTGDQRAKIEQWLGRNGSEFVKTDEFEVRARAGEVADFDALTKAASEDLFDVIAFSTIDDLGRRLEELYGNLAALQATGKTIVMVEQGVDTSTPAGQTMLRMMRGG